MSSILEMMGHKAIEIGHLWLGYRFSLPKVLLGIGNTANDKPKWKEKSMMMMLRTQETIEKLDNDMDSDENFGQWIIRDYDGGIVYRCPDSQFAMFPPESGWVPVDERDVPIPSITIRLE